MPVISDDVKVILRYGDSNMWGYIPKELTNKESYKIERFDRFIRWPGVLQQKLGNGYHVIEDGLNGRTTNIDYPISPDRNGLIYLSPCLYSHAPVDLVVILLGGNDLKSCFKRTPREIVSGLSQIINTIQQSAYGKSFSTSP